MSEPQTGPAKSLFSRTGRHLLEAVVRGVGARRIMRVVQTVEPTLVGAWSESDYPRHLTDPAFARVEKLTRAHTLVDILRRHEIWVQVGQSAKLGDGDILEVGVWRGGTGLLIGDNDSDLEAARAAGIAGKKYTSGSLRTFVASALDDIAGASD